MYIIYVLYKGLALGFVRKPGDNIVNIADIYCVLRMKQSRIGLNLD